MEQFKKWYAGQDVLVIGGAGFIGSHLVEALVACQAQVTVFDNLSTGSLENLAAVKNEITFVEGDICSKKQVQAVVKGMKYIFHAAALVSVQQSMQDPESCYQVNVEGTKNIIDALDPFFLQTIIFSSTAAVYGRHEGICDEEVTPDPLSPYAKTKLAGEALLLEVAEKKGISVGILRYFNVFGSRQNPFGAYASVVPRFLEALKNEEPLTIFGDGLQVRDFVSVEEIVVANMTAAIVASKQKVFCNVASGKGITLLELIIALEKQIGKKAVAVNFVAPREGEVRHSVASIDRLQELYESFRLLDKACEKTYFQNVETYQQRDV